MAFIRCKYCNSVLDPEKVRKNKFGRYCSKGCKILYKKKVGANQHETDSKDNERKWI
jgi:hypothetical protein